MMKPKYCWLLMSFCACVQGQTAGFQPGPLTLERLRAAAAAAGFQVRDAMGDIPKAARSSLPFTPLEYDDPKLAALRAKYPIVEAVAGAKDEWTAQLRLKQWVYARIPGGNPTSTPGTAIEILDRAARGERFYCTYYAITYAECAQALGWQARKIGVDRKHGPEGMGSTHHGVAEVWSNQFRKWVVMDSQSNLHFEKKGAPLSSWEIRTEWLKNGGADVEHVVGIPPKAVRKNPAIVWWSLPDEDETATYFWVYIADRVSAGSDAKLILPLDEANTGLVWYQNGSSPGNSRLHTGYVRNSFVPAWRAEDAYWTVGIVEARIVSASASTIKLKLDGYDPYRKAYEVSFDGVAWQRVADTAGVAWSLKSGWNTLRLRSAGPRGVTGPETAVAMLLTAKANPR